MTDSQHLPTCLYQQREADLETGEEYWRSVEKHLPPPVSDAKGPWDESEKDDER